MARIRFRDFSAGLWASPPREDSPPGTLRRASGIRGPHMPVLRSRWGSVKVIDIGPQLVPLHSLYTYRGVRYQGVGTTFRADGVVIAGGLSGKRLGFATGLAVAGVKIGSLPDQLFVADGRFPFKVQAGNFVTRWGIQHPPAGMRATALPFVPGVSEKTWDAFDTTAIYHVTDDNHGFVIDTTVVPPDTATSLKVTSGGSDAVFFERPMGEIALDRFGTDYTYVSYEQDWICCDIRVDKPENLERIQFIFAIGDITVDALSRTLTRDVLVSDGVVQDLNRQATGIGDVPSLRGDQPAVVSQLPDGTPPPAPQVHKITAEDLGVTSIPSTQDTWVRLRLPKSSFVRAGFAPDEPAWEKITAMKIVITRRRTGDNFPLTVWFANGKLQGGTGMQGEYRHFCSYRNPRTGTQSMPMASRDPGSGAYTFTPTETIVVPRTGARLTGIPTSSDLQAPETMLWRTLGNGSVFFLCAIGFGGTWRYSGDRQSDSGPGFGPHDFTDHVADFEGMAVLQESQRANLATLPIRPVNLMGEEQLTFDHVPPEPTAEDVWGPVNGQLFMTRDRAEGHEGRIYFSVPGRLEDFPDYVEPTSAADPMQKGVAWNGVAYAFSQQKCFELVPAGETYQTREVFGVPGTLAPFTVVATPFGIVYVAPDGVRRFDGTQSELVAFPAVAALFRGEAPIAGGIGPFATSGEDLVAEYWNDEYFLSDGQKTLALNLRVGAWREVGYPFTALHREGETNILTIGSAGDVYEWERPGLVSDNGFPIIFSVQTPSVLVDAGMNVFVTQRLYVDADTHGQTLLATVFNAETGVPLGGGPYPIVTFGRETVEVSLGMLTGSPYVSVVGSLRDEVFLYGVELDMHVPEAPGQT